MVENKQEKTLFSGDKLVNVGLCFRTLVTISLSRKVEKQQQQQQQQHPDFEQDLSIILILLTHSYLGAVKPLG